MKIINSKTQNSNNSKMCSRLKKGVTFYQIIARMIARKYHQTKTLKRKLINKANKTLFNNLNKQRSKNKKRKQSHKISHNLNQKNIDAKIIIDNSNQGDAVESIGQITDNNLESFSKT